MSTEKIKVSVVGDELLKASQKTVERAQINWKENWSWIVPECVEMQNDLAEISAKQIKQGYEKPIEVDDRTLKPYPITSSGMYGWVAAKDNFKLDVYGPDVYKFPLPKENKIL